MDVTTKLYFEIMHCGLNANVAIMKEYTDLRAFVMKSFYKNDEAVSADIHKLAEKISNRSISQALIKMNPSHFLPGLDLQLMYREMYLALEEYLWKKCGAEYWMPIAWSMILPK